VIARRNGPKVEELAMDSVDQSTGTPGQGFEEKRKFDAASARLQGSWDEAASTVKSKILGARGQARQKLTAVKEATAAKALGARMSLERKVQEHPLKAVGYAFGAGALLGLLLRRRFRRR
jgi:ElaB/YqjD/DUF883 family membrane-anchored ribosome-binding protein